MPAFSAWAPVVGESIASAAKAYSDTILEAPKRQDEEEERQFNRRMRPLKLRGAEIDLQQAEEELTAPKALGYGGGYRVWNPQTKTWDVHAAPAHSYRPSDYQTKLDLIRKGESPDATEEDRALADLARQDLSAKAKQADSLGQRRAAQTKNDQAKAAIAARLAGMREKLTEAQVHLMTERVKQVESTVGLNTQRIQYLQAQAQGLRDRAKHFENVDANMARHYNTEADKLIEQAREFDEKSIREWDKLDQMADNMESQIRTREGNLGVHETAEARKQREGERKGTQQDRSLDLRERDMARKQVADTQRAAIQQRALDLRAQMGQANIISRETMAADRLTNALIQQYERLITAEDIATKRIEATGDMQAQREIAAIQKQQDRLTAEILKAQARLEASIHRDMTQSTEKALDRESREKNAAQRAQQQQQRQQQQQQNRQQPTLKIDAFGPTITYRTEEDIAIHQQAMDQLKGKRPQEALQLIQRQPTHHAQMIWRQTWQEVGQGRALPLTSPMPQMFQDTPSTPPTPAPPQGGVLPATKEEEDDEDAIEQYVGSAKTRDAVIERYQKIKSKLTPRQKAVFQSAFGQVWGGEKLPD